MKSDSGNFEDWLAKAENDLMAARGILFYYEEPPTDTICYHAHQVAEKSLKAFLVAKSGSLPRTHDLIELINLCSVLDKAIGDKKEATEILNKYYIDAKYPPDLPVNYPKSDAEEAVRLAETIIKMIRDKLNEVK